jgi:hypothetical protein
MAWGLYTTITRKWRFVVRRKQSTQQNMGTRQLAAFPCVNTEAHDKDDLRRALGKHNKEASTYAPKRTTKMIFVVC